MRILVIGSGYVGLSTAVLLSKKNDVVICDVDEHKVKMVNRGEAPFQDADINKHLLHNTRIQAVLPSEIGYTIFDYLIIAVQTNIDDTNNDLDTSIVEDIINRTHSSKTTIVIRSTISFDFALKLERDYSTDRILYCPEFLREGTAISDVLHPDRIIVGGEKELAQKYIELFLSEISLPISKIVYVSLKEATVIKLFANTFLALRISFFNELDNFALLNNLNSKKCIEGICLDNRIGNFYNNPSFGFGGTCLPKDTKSLAKAMSAIPHSIIKTICDSNSQRKEIIVNDIIQHQCNTVGMYRLSFKKDSKNMINSASLDICDMLRRKGIRIIVFEPLIKNKTIQGLEVENDFDSFVKKSEIILANRIDNSLLDINKTIYTRDVFNCN